MNYLLPLALLFVISCNSAIKSSATIDAPKGTIDAMLEHNEFERSYILYVPESYNPATP